MAAASEALEYERAARLRDQAAAVDKALARQEVATTRKEDFDLLAVAEDDLEAALVVLTVRRGRVTGRLATVVDKVEEVATPELVGRLLREVYGDDRPPPEVLVPVLPDEAGVWQEWLAARRGGRLVLRVPQSGAKRRLLATAQANAAEVFARHRLQRHGDHNARARALRSLQDALGLPEPPLRIECYDISTIQGTDTVGSMVVMEDGLPRRNQYRRFRIRRVDGQDDFAAMEEVLRRRLTAYLREREQPVEERGASPTRPSLLLVDGGAGQVSRAVQVVADLGLAIPVAGLAKRMEEVHLPGQAEPLRLARDRGGALLAAAGARRGAPLRRGLPPHPAGAAYGGLGTRRGARGGPGPAPGPAAALRVAGEDAGGRSGGVEPGGPGRGGGGGACRPARPGAARRRAPAPVRREREGARWLSGRNWW